MQTVILVSAGLAAAFGPLLIAIGSMVSALGPLVSVIVARLVPAFVAFKIEIAALTTFAGPAAAAARVLTVALRGLLIATGVGAAIAALAGAIYLVYRRTTETTPATKPTLRRSIPRSKRRPMRMWLFAISLRHRARPRFRLSRKRKRSARTPSKNWRAHRRP